MSLALTPRQLKVTLSAGAGRGELNFSKATPELILTLLPALQGPAGPAGASGSSYTHTQAGAATTWTVNHNLGFKPNTSVQSVGGVEIWAEILHVSTNQLLVLFDAPFNGFAVCS